MKAIKFTDARGFHKEYEPKPASAFVPDWYKEMESYMGGTKRPDEYGARGTIKKCMPVFDAITSGYIITTFVDIWVTQMPGSATIYTWSNFEPIKFHPNEQADKHPAAKDFKFNFPKFVNPWIIETPPGYSCLFMPPAHRDNPITIFPGVVDTDTYALNVEFPFMLTDPNFDGLIPAGTPIAQVMPFKRENWESSVGADQERAKAATIKNVLISKFYQVYKDKYWVKKHYK